MITCHACGKVGHREGGLVCALRPVEPVVISEPRPVEPIEHVAPEQTYKLVTISLYLDDIARMDALVAELKRRGLRRANKSWLIRYALAQVSVDEVAASMTQRKGTP